MRYDHFRTVQFFFAVINYCSNGQQEWRLAYGEIEKRTEAAQTYQGTANESRLPQWPEDQSKDEICQGDTDELNHEHKIIQHERVIRTPNKCGLPSKIGSDDRSFYTVMQNFPREQHRQNSEPRQAFEVPLFICSRQTAFYSITVCASSSFAHIAAISSVSFCRDKHTTTSHVGLR